MASKLMRVLRHRWFDESDARRAVPPALSEQLRRRVHASEQRHTGEVRICIEGGLPTSYLWRHLRDGESIANIVRQRALMQFSKLRVWDTEDNNGVLIYVLLAEHAIELVADRGVHRRVPPGEWQAIVGRLADALKTGNFEDGLTRALEEVSAVLVAHFPQADPRPDSGAEAPPNQLPDEPVLR
ncbi:TPM domain-containing protein [Ottowia sp. GY511]|uniref:TPM domain-containing protein n=1 Tax=Ottowia flava TaxID=2675430 RepID=A0ABW4KX70_9BURK|nr:TPM domain-containing protein [Ottowia sp. GY511]TXK27345.1 TPM domain-containing protein [Ottowia sp. GY511]